MAAIKDDITKLSVNQLSLITGVAYNTVKRRLSGLDPIYKDGRTMIYLTSEALGKIYETVESEKTRLDRARAEQIEFDTSIKKGQYAPIDTLQFAVADFAQQANSILAAIPKRVKNSLPGLRAREIKIIEREIVKAKNAASEIQVKFDTD